MPPDMEAAFSRKFRGLADKGFGLTKHLFQVKTG